VTSDRQIAANRRNARISTGPRSGGGKKRASSNAYRHGLTAKTLSSAELAKAVERLARKIAGEGADTLTFEHARAVAQAELDLAWIRQVKVAVIERLLAFGKLETSESAQSVETGATMPSTEPDRTAEAVRQALPELVKLDRYERRATAQRARVALIINR
jgi:hypothetical protein